MNETIQAFLNSGKVAIAGASPHKENFGLSLMTELDKLGKEVYPINPKHKDIHKKLCYPSVKEIPGDVESLILAVPPEICEQITEECIETGIKRVWMVRGVGKGAYSAKAHITCQENRIDVVYGFCPMMFFGKGLHKFHFWLRKTFGKLPEEYWLSDS